MQPCRLSAHWTLYTRNHNPKTNTQIQENVDACCQRWFYGGKLLGDKILVEDAQIQPQYIVQVIVNTEHYNHGVNS